MVSLAGKIAAIVQKMAKFMENGGGGGIVPILHFDVQALHIGKSLDGGIFAVKFRHGDIFRGHIKVPAVVHKQIAETLRQQREHLCAAVHIAFPYLPDGFHRGKPVCHIRPHFLLRHRLPHTEEMPSVGIEAVVGRIEGKGAQLQGIFRRAGNMQFWKGGVTEKLLSPAAPQKESNHSRQQPGKPSSCCHNAPYRS